MGCGDSDRVLSEGSLFAPPPRCLVLFSASPPSCYSLETRQRGVVPSLLLYGYLTLLSEFWVL